MAQNPDVIVIGAALSGLTAALALGGSKTRRPLNVLVVDARDPQSFLPDGRASAITASGKAMFEALGVWPSLVPHAQLIADISVTDAAVGADDRPSLLHFGETGTSAAMIENRHLHQGLLAAAKQSPHITFQTGSPVTDYNFRPGLARITTAEGASFRGPLIIAADGANSRARAAAGIAMHGWNYGQTGLVATIAHELPHHGLAEEHFTPSGPFAILPLPGNRSSLVWTEWRDDAAKLLALDDAGFLDEISRRFGSGRGAISLEGGRHSYPLSMFIAEEFTGPRLALIGDAAHVVHPLAGLGFNLGLRDAAALAECVHDAFALGSDPGGDAVLARYTRWRRFDTVTTAMALDGLNRLFANDNPALKALRDTGLSMVNKIPPLKSLFVTQAAGQSGSLPKLMRGEVI